MLSNFLVSIQAVLPLFFLMTLGFFVRKKRWLNDAELKKFNSVIFKILFPFMVFSSIHKTDLSASFYPPLMIFCVVAILTVYVISLPVVLGIEKTSASRGAMIQAIYRSNFVLLGLPLVSNIYQGADLGMTALAVAVLIPLFNVLAVITLEVFRGGKPNLKTILRGIATNPLILGCVAGLLCIPVELPLVLETTIQQLSACASPMALILLGASFHLEHHARYRRNLILCTLCKLVLVPGVCLTAAALLGFRDMAFVTMIGVFASPCAVSSFTMAQQMDSDGELAGACVVYTSLFSCFTMFLWIFLFKQIGIF